MRNKIALALIVLFIAGAAVIVYSGRPAGNTPPADNNPASSSQDADGSYTPAEVESHATVNDCWATINGEVYDLTSWVSRHPGGAQAITRLCGTDGTAAFDRQHGGSRAAQAALVLLKIGKLQ